MRKAFVSSAMGIVAASGRCHYEYLEDGALLRDPLPVSFEGATRAASETTFEHVA